MKNIILYLLFLIVLNSCSSDDNHNTSPTIPSLTYPTNNLVCIDNTVNFQWSSSIDDQDDAITYQLEIATDNAFKQNLNTSTISTLNKEITLVKGKLYYWRVKATDSKNSSSSYSSTNNFYTEGIGIVNHVPFAPEIVAPALNSTQNNSSLNLSWTAVDADQDALTFDVYFGKTNPPTEKVASNITSNSFTPSVSTTGIYYWNIVVKDSKGGITVGQIWNFTKK